MRNYVQQGDVMTFTAPAGGIASGAGFLVGSLFVIAAFAAEAGQPVEGALVGVYELPKVSAQAWAQGAKVYWDDAAKLVTTTAGGNTLIGSAALAASNPSALGQVRLNGVA